jgi:hypothetical protein
MPLRESFKLICFNILDTATIHLALRDQSFCDEVIKPLAAIGVDVVVVDGQGLLL